MGNLIFDRTQLDIDNDTEKGQYTHTDLNRVESWCKYIADVLNGYNYYVSIDAKTNWKESDYHWSEDLERIRQNVNRLKEAYFSFTQIPANLEYMTWQKANDIEKILFEIDKIIGYMENDFIYCGVPSCGQNRLWQQRFRKLKTWNAQPYKLSQFLDTDTLKMIATDNGIKHESSTQILGITQIDKRDDVFASIESTNNSMKKIDDLVGFEARYYTLKNLCSEINGMNGFNIRSNSGTGVGESSAVHTKYSQQALKLNIVDTNTTEVYANSSTSLPLNPEHIYYARIEAYQETKFGAVELYFPIAEPQMFNLATGDVGKWNMYSVVKERSSFTAGNYTFRLDFNRERSTETAGSIWYDGWMIIDLTEAFGSGNEPTKEWCDKNIPYFTGTYTHKEPVEPYTEIEYLQSSGTQYIDTGIAGNNDNLEIVVEYKMLEFKSYGGVFGNYNSESDNCWRMLQTNTDNDKYYLNTNTKGGGGTITISMPKNVVHKVVMNKNRIIVDGVEYDTSSNKGTENSSNIVLFRQKSTNASSIMQLYSWKVYDGKLIQNLVPVKDKNGTYCMFDKVTKQFFYSQGTGSFGGA